MIPFEFTAVDKSGEPVKGTIQGADEESVRRALEHDFGYQVQSIFSHTPGEDTVIPHSSKSEESIIFNASTKAPIRPPAVPPHQLDSAQVEIEELLSGSSAAISDSSRDILRNLLAKIEWVRSSQNKQHWKRLQYQMKVELKQVRREIERYEQLQWDRLEKKKTGIHDENYDVSDESLTVRKPTFIREKLGSIRERMRVLNRPDPHAEHEVIIKQQYESVWIELQRFMGALFVFYLVCFFIAYYLKDAGSVDHILVRIYDTTLFKQLVISLFSLYGILALRSSFLPKRLLTDLILVLTFAGLMLVVFR